MIDGPNGGFVFGLKQMKTSHVLRPVIHRRRWWMMKDIGVSKSIGLFWESAARRILIGHEQSQYLTLSRSEIVLKNFVMVAFAGARVSPVWYLVSSLH